MLETRATQRRSSSDLLPPIDIGLYVIGCEKLGYIPKCAYISNPIESNRKPPPRTKLMAIAEPRKAIGKRRVCVTARMSQHAVCLRFEPSSKGAFA